MLQSSAAQEKLAKLDVEQADLQKNFAQAVKEVTDVQKFFSISEKAANNLPPPEVWSRAYVRVCM